MTQRATGALKDALTCEICFNIFTAEGSRIPLVLPCGHSFCRTCCVAFDSKCPACRREFQGGVRSLSRNFALLRLLESAPNDLVTSNSPSVVTEISMWLHDCGPEFQKHVGGFHSNGVTSFEDLEAVQNSQGLYSELLAALVAGPGTLGAKAKEQALIKAKVDAVLAQPDLIERYAVMRDEERRKLDEAKAKANTDAEIEAGTSAVPSLETVQAVCEFVTNNPTAANSPVVAEAVLRQIHELASYNDYRELFAENLNPIQVWLQRVMYAQATSNASIARWGCAALWSLSFHETMCISLGESGACDIVLDALRGHPGSVSVAEQACAAIGNLSITEENNTKLGESGACRLVVAAIRDHIADNGVTREGCAATSNLALSEANQVKLVEADACAVVLRAFEFHGDFPSVLKYACTAITNLAASNEDNARTFGVAGACAAVLGTMTRFRWDEEVIIECLSAIAALSYIETNAKRLADSGACAAVVQVIRDFSDDPDVLHWACRAVWVLGDHKDDASTWAGKLGVVGACEAVVDVLRRHPEHVWCANWGCAAVWSLGFNDDNTALLLTAGVCGVVLDALRNHPDNPQVVEQACAAVGNLTASDDCNVIFGDGGACELVTKALRDHSGEPSVVKEACAALGNLAMDVKNAQRLCDSGACELVVNCLTADAPDPFVAEFACWAVVGLASKHPDNMRLLGQAGACAALVKILKDNPFSEEIAEECSEALANLCVCVDDDPDDPDAIVTPLINVSNQDRMASENAIGVVMGVISNCFYSMVNEKCSLAIAHLICNHEQNKQQLLAFEGWQGQLERLASCDSGATTRKGRTHVRRVLRQLLLAGNVEFDPSRSLADFTSDFDESSSDDEEGDESLEESGSDVWVSDLEEEEDEEDED